MCRYEGEGGKSMVVRVEIPTPFRAFAGDSEYVTATGRTINEVLNNLTGENIQLRRHLFSDDGHLRSYINVYLNDRDIRHLRRGNTAVAEADVVSIVPSIAGGSAGRDDVPLSPSELQRYHRHIIMPEVGIEGQKRIKASKVLIIGAGGLGSPLALYLAAAGVGTIGIVDFDVVDISNLQRQVLYDTKDLGRSKLASACDRIKDLNPGIEVVPYETQLTSQNALDILSGYDIIVDGTDNFPTRYLVNDACVLLGKPNVYGSIFRFDGQVSVFDATRGPCYRCLYPSPPPPGLVPSCAEGGVLGVLPGIVGSMQAVETLKLILGQGDPLIGRLILFDALNMSFREMKLRKDPECPVCGKHRTIDKLIDYDQFCGVTPDGTNGNAGREFEVTPEELKQRLDGGEEIQILDVREMHEYQIANLGGLLIPLSELPKRLSELDPSVELIVHCKTGRRSARAVEILRQTGFTRVKNLVGGITAWAERIDPSMKRY